MFLLTLSLFGDEFFEGIAHCSSLLGPFYPLLKDYFVLFGPQMPQNISQRLLSGSVPLNLFLLLYQTINTRIFVL